MSSGLKDWFTIGANRKTISGATHLLSSADNAYHLVFTAGGGCVVTVPAALAADFFCGWCRMGGQISFVLAAAGSINNVNGETKSGGVYAEGTLRVDSNAGTAPVVILSGVTGA